MCLRGLQKISARCGLLPKSYWISHSILAEPDGTPSTGGVSSTCQRLMDGKLVAVKAISPDCVENLDTFKRVRLPAPPTYLPLIIAAFCFGSYRNCGPMESCGSDCGIRTWSLSLGSAQSLLPSPLYTPGCPTRVCPSTCARTPMPINLVWYVITPSTVVNHHNDPDLPTAVGSRPWVGLPAQV